MEIERKYDEAVRVLMNVQANPSMIGGEEYQLAVQKLCVAAANLRQEFNFLRDLSEKPRFSERERIRREKWLGTHPMGTWHKDRGEVLRRAAAELWAAGNINLAVAMIELCPEAFPELYDLI